jgi:arylsulfatase A-like enzyme
VRDRPPNVVLLIADQLRSDAVGLAGNPVSRTPNLDALATAGTAFTEAYVQHPVCSPSRVSFLTGWYPHVRGHRTLTHLLQPDEPNLLRILREVGYHVSWAGERGDTFAPGVTELSVDEYGFDHRPTRPLAHEFSSDLHARLFYGGRLPTGGTDHDEAAVVTAERRLASSPPEPWALVVAFMAPHCPFQVEEPWFSMIDRDAVPDPLPVPAGRQAAFKEALRTRAGLDRATPELWREVAAVYHGMVARLDSHVGRVLGAVERSGQADRTVTVFFSDHGEYLGDFGLVEKWPSAMDRCITATPLIVAGAGLPGGRRCGAPVELVDVLPTVLELAGVEAPHHHFGRSLVPLLHDPGGHHRSHAFTEGGFTEAEEPQLERAPFPYDIKAGLQHEQPRLVGRSVAVRNRRWTYVWRLYEPPELYDRRSDPSESVDLSGTEAAHDVEADMADALLRWQVETSDVIPTVEDPRSPAVDRPFALDMTGPPDARIEDDHRR